MSKKFEICSATYNIALNQDEDDVFGTGCAHLYHFLQGNCNYGKSGVYKPMMLKMHLELNELIEETEQQIVEHSNTAERPLIQQLEAKFQSLEYSLQANNADAVNKLMERIEKKLENIVHKVTDIGNNTIDQESKNAFLNSSDNAPRQSDKQLEEKLKTLEDALQAKKKLENIVHKVTDIGNNTIDQESKNAFLNSSDNAPRQSDKQLEEKLKTLEDALQAKDDVVNEIIERMEKLERNFTNNFGNKATDVGNNTIDHESINALLNSSEISVKQSVQQHEKEINALKDCIEKLVNNKAVNETAYIGNPTTHDNSTEKQQQQKEIQFDKDNLIQIWSIKSSDSSLETAIHNVIQYAKEIKLSLTRDQIKHIDVRILDQDILIYYVFLSTRAIKEAFLMKRDILKRSPHNLTVRNGSEYNSVYIRNFKSSDLSYDSAIANVIGLANQMGLTLMPDQIRTLDVFRVNQSSSVCCVEFYTTQMENEFLNKSHILKELPATKSFEIY